MSGFPPAISVVAAFDPLRTLATRLNSRREAFPNYSAGGVPHWKRDNRRLALYRSICLLWRLETARIAGRRGDADSARDHRNYDLEICRAAFVRRGE